MSATPAPQSPRRSRRHAQAAGAAAIVATTPYYWTPPPAMVLEHFVQIGAAVDIPFFVLNAPDDMAGSKINTDLARKLIDKLPNFAGVVDASLDWQFMIELLTDAARVRPGFELISGNELMVSAAAIGASGLFSALAAVAPKLVRGLFDLCRAAKTFRGPRAARRDRGASSNRQARRRCRAQGRRARHGPRLWQSAPAAVAARCCGRKETCGRDRSAAVARRRTARVVSIKPPSARRRAPKPVRSSMRPRD